MAVKIGKASPLVNLNKAAKAPPQANQYATHLQASPITQHTEIVKKGADNQKQLVKDEQTDLHPGVITNKKTSLSLSFKGSKTINLGNYESATVAVMLTAPCEPGDLEQTYEWVTDWVSNKMLEAITDAKGTA